MQKTILMIVAVALVGCSKKTTTDKVDGQPVNPSVGENKPEEQLKPPKVIPEKLIANPIVEKSEQTVVNPLEQEIAALMKRCQQSLASGEMTEEQSQIIMQMMAMAGMKPAAAEAATPPVPTIITNVVTNVLKEVVTNIVTAQPPAASSTAPPVLDDDELLARMSELLRLRQAEMNRRSLRESYPKIEAAIRWSLNKPTGELTEADLEKVTELILDNNQLTDVKGLEKLTQLKDLDLSKNQLTSVKGLEKFTQLTELSLDYNKLTNVKGLEKLTQLKFLDLQVNPDLTKAQIEELQKALPKCEIRHNAKN